MDSTKFPLIGISSIDTPSGPIKPSFLQRLKTFVQRGWRLEFACHFFSVLIFLSIFAILYHLDKTPYYGPIWKKISFFGIVTFLGTMMKTAMFVGVASALGQLRWSWYKEHRKLADLETFEGATSSPMGSFKLLLTFKFRHLACFGAVLTIMALSIEALISSTMKILPRTLLSGITSLPISNHYQTYAQRANQEWPALEMVSAIQLGSSFLTGLDLIVNASWAVTCETGNCTFKRYQSIAVVSDCITEDVSLSNGNYVLANYTGVLTLPADTGVIAVNSSTGYPDGLPFGDIGPPIARTGIIVNKNGWSQPLGMHCVLYWANKDLVASVSNVSAFRLDEQVLSTRFTTRDQAYNSQGYSWMASECWINGTSCPTKNPDGSWAQEQCNYFVGPQSQRGLENYFTDQTYRFTGSLLNSDNYSTQATPFVQNINFITGSDQATAQDMIRELWMNTAITMTRATRVVQSTTQYTTLGQMWTTENYLYVYWYYLILPGAMVVACTLFTFLACITTRHDYPWKKSSLPFLFLGLDRKGIFDCKDVRTLEEMKEAAERMDVKLDQTPDDGLKFVRKE